MPNVSVTDRASECVVSTHEGVTTKGASKSRDLGAMGWWAFGNLGVVTDHTSVGVKISSTGNSDTHELANQKGLDKKEEGQ